MEDCQCIPAQILIQNNSGNNGEISLVDLLGGNIDGRIVDSGDDSEDDSDDFGITGRAATCRINQINR